jgi:pimeloyl-ACP methyl ester carboxylesterase
VAPESPSPAHADDLAAVIESLAYGPVPVVGHSMGAFVGVATADRYRDLVGAVLLVAGGLPLSAPVDPGPARARLAMTLPRASAETSGATTRRWSRPGDDDHVVGSPRRTTLGRHTR